MKNAKPRLIVAAIALTLAAMSGMRLYAQNAMTLPNGWRVTPAGTPIALPGDLPLKIIVTPDRKSLLVNTGGYHDHSVSVINLASCKLTQSVNLGKDWCGMALNANSGDLYVAGGGSPDARFLAGVPKLGATPELMASFHAPVLHLTLQKGMLTLQPGIAIPSLNEAVESIPNDYHLKRDRFIAGLTTGPNDSLYVVNLQTDTVYKLTGPDHALAGSVKVGYRPYAAALSPDGAALAVSNWGGQSVSLLETKTSKETDRVAVGSHPNDLVWGKDGRLFVANSGSNSVSVIAHGVVIETIKTSLSPTDPVGSTPDALALTADETRLYVANADNNDVAVIDTSNARESRVLGFIPTGWYPSALAVAPDGKTLYVGTGKGLQFRPNFPPRAAAKPRTDNSPVPYDYIGNILSGTVSIVPVPNAHQLVMYTRQVIANTPKLLIERVNGAFPLHSVVPDKIKHVLYIIRENRTYDQVFGDIKTGNGDPDLTMFGDTFTPNAHALAQHYVLLDNLYTNGEVSEDGHKWCDAAYATDFNERSWPSSYSGRGEPDGDARIEDSPAGEIWDNCARHGLTYRSYGEAADFHSTPDTPPVFVGDRGLVGHVNTEWAKFPFGVGRDTQRAAIFIKELHDAEKTGRWPQFMVAWLPEDHTTGLKAGAYTPTAAVASNDQALGQIVEAISHSRFWPETAIFVIEDDAQNGPDHVDAHRTVGLVISPYARRHAVDSTMYTTTSYVHTMEMILGLPPMTQFDRAATPLYNAFTLQADLASYTNLPSRVDLDAKNPAVGPGAAASAKLDFSDADRANPDALNAILWYALKPGKPMPAPVRSARLVR